MKFNLKNTALDYEGKSLKESDGKGEIVEVTFRMVINAALNNGNTPNLTPEQKNKIFQISTKVWRSWKVDLTHDDCAFIKERAGTSLNPLLFGRLDEFLEQKEIDVPLPEEDQERELEEDDKTKVKALK